MTYLPLALTSVYPRLEKVKLSHSCPLYTPLHHLPTRLPHKLNKSVPQMMHLMPLAEVPLFYPPTCGQKHWAVEKDQGEKKHYLTRKTPLLSCTGRGEKHMEMKVVWKISELTTLPCGLFFFGNTMCPYDMGNPYEDINKKHIQEVLWLLCSHDRVLLKEIFKGSFPDFAKGKWHLQLRDRWAQQVGKEVEDLIRKRMPL